MQRILVDFNEQTIAGAVRLTTNRSKESLERNPVSVGDHVMVTDGELEAPAMIDEENGSMIAWVEWEQIEELWNADQAYG